MTTGAPLTGIESRETLMPPVYYLVSMGVFAVVVVTPPDHPDQTSNSAWAGPGAGRANAGNSTPKSLALREVIV